MTAHDIETKDCGRSQTAPTVIRIGRNQLLTPALELDNLSVFFNGRPILKDLNGAFSGRAIGLLGPNGAGKSTLIQTLLGFHPPTKGSAKILGMDVRTEIRPIRNVIGYMPENDSFITGMTGIRLVRMMAELSGLPPAEALERAHETLFRLGLGEARYRDVGTYSLGMKQMAKLAVAIVHGPRMLILDEPTNGLDVHARKQMLQIIREVRDSQDTQIILCSHLLRDVEECCDEVMILKNGLLVSHCNLEAERRTNRKFIQMETRGETGGFL